MRTPSSVPMLFRTAIDGRTGPTLPLPRANGPNKDDEPVGDFVSSSIHQAASSPPSDHDLEDKMEPLDPIV